MEDHVHVCPGGGTPRNLPPGVNTDAVQSAGNLDSALKQVESVKELLASWNGGLDN